MKTKIIIVSSALLFCACSAPLAYAPQEYPQQNPVQNQAQTYPQNQAQVYPQQAYQTSAQAPAQTYPQQSYPQQTYPQNPYQPQAYPATTQVQTTSSQTQTPAYTQSPAQNYAGVLPQNIMDYIQSNYPNTFIKDMDFEGYGWEIELSNNLDVYFDSNGNFLGAKWD